MKTNNIVLNTLDSFFAGFWHIVCLGIFIGLIGWICVLHLYFDMSWIFSFKSISQIFQTNNQYLRAIFGLCICLGLTLSSWLHTWLHLRGNMPVGDQFSRGARVVDSNSKY